MHTHKAKLDFVNFTFFLLKKVEIVSPFLKVETFKYLPFEFPVKIITYISPPFPKKVIDLFLTLIRMVELVPVSKADFLGS